MALSIEKQIYFNLVHVFYSNMKIFTNMLDRIIINIGEVPIEFDKENSSHKIYKSKKAPSFVDFVHSRAIKNICRHKDLSDDVLSLPFCSQLLSSQVRLLHTILQHIITYEGPFI